MGILMQSIPVFLGIAKFTDFWWKNADASRTQVVIYIFFGSSLGKVQLPSVIIVRYVRHILGRGDFLAPPNPWAISEKTHHQ